MAKARVNPDLVREAYARLIGPIREKAKELGYAIGVHGSLERDIDLIACPWTHDAVNERGLAEAIISVVSEHNRGVAYMDPLEHGDGWFRNGCQPHGKAHGRRCWGIHLGEGAYIDLSVMPRCFD